MKASLSHVIRFVTLSILCFSIGYLSEISAISQTALPKINIFTVDQHEVLSAVWDQIGDAKTNKNYEKLIPLYFGVIDYVKKMSGPRPLVPFINSSISRFDDPLTWVYRDLAKLAHDGVFESHCISDLKGVNALIDVLYHEALADGNLDSLKDHLEKMIVSPKRKDMFEALIGYYWERGQFEEVSIYTSLYNIIADRNFLSVPEKVLDNLSQAQSDPVMIEDGKITVAPDWQGNYTLDLVFEKHSQFQLWLTPHPDGFLIQAGHVLSAYDPRGRKLWERNIISESKSDVMIQTPYIFVKNDNYIFIFDLKTGNVIYTFNLEKTLPGSVYAGMFAVGHKLYIEVLQNVKKLLLISLDLNSFDVHSIYLGDVRFFDENPQVLREFPLPSVHFSRWGHSLFISNSFGMIFDVDLVSETLTSAIKVQEPGDLLIWKQSLIGNSNGRILFLNLVTGDLLLKSMGIEGLDGHTKFVRTNMNFVYGLYDRLSGLAYRQQGRGCGVYVFNELNIKLKANSDTDLEPVVTQNAIYFYDTEKKQMMGYSVSSQTVQKTDYQRYPDFLVQIPFLEHVAFIKDFKISNGYIFLATDHSVLAYSLKKINSAYMADLKASMKNKKDPHDQALFLIQFLDQKEPEVRLYVKKELISLGKPAVDLLLDSLPHVSDDTRRQMEEILDEMLYQFSPRIATEGSAWGDYYETYYDLFLWGYEKLAASKDRLILTALPGADPGKEFQLLSKALNDSNDSVREHAIVRLMDGWNAYPHDQKMIIEKIRSHYDVENVDYIRGEIIDHTHVFPQEDQKIIYIHALDDKHSTNRQWALRLLFGLIEKCKQVTPQDLAILYRFLGDSSQELRLESLKILISLLDRAGMDSESISRQIICRYETEDSKVVRTMILSNCTHLTEANQLLLLWLAIRDSESFIQIEAMIALIKYVKGHAEYEGEFVTQLNRRPLSQDVAKILFNEREIFSAEHQVDFYESLLHCDENPAIRKKGIQGLFDLIDSSQFRTQCLEKLLSHFEKEPDPELRYAIVFGWSLLPVEEVRSCLLKAKSDPDDTVRSAAETFIHSNQNK